MFQRRADFCPQRGGVRFVFVGLEGVGGVFAVVVARQVLCGVCLAVVAQVLAGAFALFVEVLQELLDGAGGRLGLVVAVAVVVDPEGFAGVADEVE